MSDLPSVITDVLVGLSLVIMTVAAIGVLTARRTITRLHFLAPVSTLGLPIFGIAAVINFGLTLGSAAVVVAILACALSAPVLTTSMARVAEAESNAYDTSNHADDQDGSSGEPI